jgi:hypothetical protein
MIEFNVASRNIHCVNFWTITPLIKLKLAHPEVGTFLQNGIGVVTLDGTMRENRLICRVAESTQGGKPNHFDLNDTIFLSGTRKPGFS